MRHAILIGSATFDSDFGIEPLRFPANDVNDLNNLVKTEDFNFQKVTLLIDEPKQVVEETLDNCFSQSSSQDFFWFIFPAMANLIRRGNYFYHVGTLKKDRLTARDFDTDI